MPIVSAGGDGSTFNGGTITEPLVIDLSGDLADRTALDVIQPATFGFSVRPFRFRQTDFAYLQMDTNGRVSTAGNDFGTSGGDVLARHVFAASGGPTVHDLDPVTPALGFFGAQAAAQPAAPVTLADVIAALKALGLVAT